MRDVRSSASDEGFRLLEAVATGEVDAEILACEAALRAAQLGGDAAALDALISDELLFAGPDGRLGTKAEDLAAHASGQVRFRVHRPEDLRMRGLAPGAVLVSLLTRLAVQVAGELKEGRFRYTRVWVREEGRGWRIAGGQVAPA